MPADGAITPILTTSITIDWGDCDEAGIVFYPNYFRWFDSGFQRLLRSRGQSQRTLRAKYGIIGTALLDVGASFRAPARYEDELVLAIGIGDWKRSSFRMTYAGSVGGRAIVDGHEVRGFVSADADGQLKAKAIDPAFKALFGATRDC